MLYKPPRRILENAQDLGSFADSPCCAGRRLNVEAEGPDPMSEPAQTRLLLVDDEASLREPLADYLTRQGFAVRQERGEEPSGDLPHRQG